MLLPALGAVHAQSLASLLELARTGEPNFLGAKSNVVAATARKNQAIGAMLPQLSANGSSNDNDRKYKTRGAGIPEAVDSYNSNSAQISLNQPIVRYANVVGWRQARVVVVQSEHQLAAVEQDLFAKLVSAWFDLLAARDAVAFAGRQAEALQRQWEIIRRGGELGIHDSPQVDEARMKLDQALSDAVTAESEVHIKRAQLEQLVGVLPERDLPFMRSLATLAAPTGETLPGWLGNVEAGNPNIRAATQAYEAALAEVSKQRAGHFPTLDLVASYGKNSQAVGGFPGQAGYDIVQGAVGVQLNVPLFSGGAQSAKVDEALAQKEKARFDIEAARRMAVLNAKQAWFGWHGAFARTRAGAQAIKSAYSALAQARVASEIGLKTELEVLQAEQQLRAGQRDFRKARYDQVVNYIKLLAVCGRLTVEDVEALDSLFVLSQDEAEAQGSQDLMQVSSR